MLDRGTGIAQTWSTGLRSIDLGLPGRYLGALYYNSTLELLCRGRIVKHRHGGPNFFRLPDAHPWCALVGWSTPSCAIEAETGLECCSA
jgi:hypothetical protein